jgi:hypothetical protein
MNFRIRLLIAACVLAVTTSTPLHAQGTLQDYQRDGTTDLFGLIWRPSNQVIVDGKSTTVGGLHHDAVVIATENKKQFEIIDQMA